MLLIRIARGHRSTGAFNCSPRSGRAHRSRANRTVHQVLTTTAVPESVITNAAQHAGVEVAVFPSGVDLFIWAGATHTHTRRCSSTSDNSTTAIYYLFLRSPLRRSIPDYFRICIVAPRVAASLAELRHCETLASQECGRRAGQ
jgi:hypothetical protein